MILSTYGRCLLNNSKVFLRGLLNNFIREKQILTSVIESKKEKKVTTHFSKIINQQYLQKASRYKAMYGVLFQIEG